MTRTVEKRLVAGGPALLLALSITSLHAAAATTPLPLDREGAVALALANDELLHQAAALVAAAEADVLAAAAGRLPQLGVGAEWSANLKKPAFFLPPELAAGFGGATTVEMGRDHSAQGAVTLTLNLWSAGRLSAAVGASRELLAAGRWQQAAVVDAVRYQATAAYLDALVIAARVAIAQEAQAMAAEALRVARAGHAEGTVSRFDLLRAEVELTNREAPLIQARHALRQAELTLARACGLAEGQAIVLTDTLGVVDDIADVEALVALMRRRSPELQALAHRAAAGRQAVALARAGRGPNVLLQGRYAVQAEWDRDLTPAGNEAATSASLGVAVSMPIFDGWRTRASVQQATAQHRAAELEEQRVARDRALAVRRAHLQLASAQAALAGRREGVALAAEAHRLAAVRLENGLATPLERLDAELALTTARVQLVDALHALNLARAALELAVGGTTITTGPEDSR